MKNILFILLISIFMEYSCAQNSAKTTDCQIPETVVKNEVELLDFYTQYSPFTDPGEYEYLYEILPDSLPELCNIVNAQFVHPFTELPRYCEEIPRERWNEAVNYPTVESVLNGLVSHNSAGLVKNRKPNERLVLGCRHNAILLASILKYRGIPARVRCGHATYLEPDFHTSHTICEVYNQNEKRWMLVDPNLGKVDFDYNEFDMSNDAWLQMQNGEINPDHYGISGMYTGPGSIIGKISNDLAAVLDLEVTIYHYAPLMDGVFDKKPLTENQTALLTTISELMTNLDAENFPKLQELYNNSPEIQLTKFYEYKLVNEEMLSETREVPAVKPTIEFVDIPGGTFIMGSPEDEAGRVDDEIQHEVTVSPFKMSKYTVTVEQYNQFCKATRRRKMFYGPYGKDENPVSQVTWHDAMAFAEWMGCRLPTEAEFEYACRANTTTAFYTGNCISTDEANFNGKEPYANCGAWKNRKRPIPVGSFAPNAFGLYDMHGNMLEWCSDWYGEYNVEDTLNPQGPETGEKKVARGGGWFEPASTSRSACRDGIPPGNKGAGISFRLVMVE